MSEQQGGNFNVEPLNPPSPAGQLSPAPQSPPTSEIYSQPSSPATLSPPTSPIAVSPASSPAAGSPPSLSRKRTSDVSPPTSPLKRQRRENAQLSLNTLRRRLLINEDYDGGHSEELSDGESNRSQHYFAHEHGSSIHLSDSNSNSAASLEGSGDDRSLEHSTSASDSDEEHLFRPNSPNFSESSADVSRSDVSDDSSDEDEGLQPLFEGSDLSVKEALYRVLKVYVEEKWTKASLNKNVKLVKSLLPQPNEFPCSGKAALKSLQDLTVSSYGEQEYLYCSVCHIALEAGSDSCVSCDDSCNLDKFYIFPPQVQLKHLFQERDLANIIDRYRDRACTAIGCINDIQDGYVYKSVKEHLTGPYDIVLLWNTDGVSMSKSSKQELWPILGTICEVPPRLRPSFLVVFGVYIGKPDMNVFLEPFVSCLKDCFNLGVSWVHPQSKMQMNSKVVAPFLSADAPAKAMVLNVMRFNARYGCNVCEQKTKKIELTPEEVRENEAIINPRKRIRRKRGFLFQEDTGSALLRTGPRMNAQGVLAEERRKSRKGVLGQAIVSQIPFFDRADGICAEYLHLLLLGTVKYLLLKIFFEDGAWYIGHRADEINEFISQIKVPDFVKRLPRGIGDFKYWKANELRNFLLFYSLPLFKILLPARYFQHWLLLVASTHILLKDTISENDIKSAEIMLKAFLRDIGPLYGPKCYTYDVHNIIHLCLLVKRAGPLWATSAFPFETFNGFIAARVHGTKHLGKELANNINIAQSIAILGNMVNGEQVRLNRRQVEETELLGKSHDKLILSEEELATLSNLGLDKFTVFLRAKHLSSVYSTKMYDADKKRSYSFVQFELGNQSVGYGEIIAFVKSVTGSVHCFIKILRVQHVQLFVHEHSRFVVKNLIPVDYSGEFSVITVDNITTKLLKIGIYLAKRPNSIEVNL